MSSALAGRFLTTVPPGKSLHYLNSDVYSRPARSSRESGHGCKFFPLSFILDMKRQMGIKIRFGSYYYYPVHMVMSQRNLEPLLY